ncbi:MAG: RHS repeat domain-containing protein [Bacteroidota bacterium]
MPRTVFTLILLLCAGVTFGQPYLPPRAAMYDQGPDPYRGPEGVREMEIWRYIPGARFETGWDLKIEERIYDEKGRLRRWTRYNTVNGQRIWQKAWTYDAHGNRTSERINLAEGTPPLVYTYRNQLGANGALQKAGIKSADSTVVARLEQQADGQLKYIELVGDREERIYAYDRNGRSLSFADLPAGKQVFYEYDEPGELTRIRQTTRDREAVTSYANSYDGDGQLIWQVEKKGERRLKRNFNYNDRGQLVSKTDEAGHPLEYRDYFANGRLASILLNGPEGHPKEVIRYVYREKSE